jgi:hypothetical protein
MKIYAVPMILLFLLLGCKMETNMFKCSGIPDGNQNLAFMYFKTEKEGYMFGTYTLFKELTEKQLDYPNNAPKATTEANIYKTTDGGKNWVKIDSIGNYSFYNNASVNGNSVLIKRIDSRADLKSHLVRFDLSNYKISHLNFHFERMGQIWSNDERVFINSKNQGVNHIYSTNYNFEEIDSVRVSQVFKENAIKLDDDFYILTWEDELYNISKQESYKLPVIARGIVRQNENSILIAGSSSTDENEISLLSYDIDNKQLKTINRFKGYSIISNLQSNDRLITGFIGNINGLFTEYDLLYSIDKGQNWQIKKLEESSYVSPSCLVDNIIYIYSGGARMQKIVLK